MKKTIVVAAVLALAGTQIQTARAGENEWATAGKILTGVAIGAAVVSAVNVSAHGSVSYYSGPGCVFPPPPPPVIYAPRVVYAPAPVVCAPRPVVVYAPPPVVVCRPPVVVVRYDSGHRHGHGRGHGHHGRR